MVFLVQTFSSHLRAFHGPRLSEKVFEGASSADMIEHLKGHEKDLEDTGFLKKNDTLKPCEFRNVTE